jgi:hypothetical protein
VWAVKCLSSVVPANTVGRQKSVVVSRNVGKKNYHYWLRNNPEERISQMDFRVHWKYTFVLLHFPRMGVLHRIYWIE